MRRRWPWQQSTWALRRPIVMPEDAPNGKLEATRNHGATIITYNRHRESREAIAAQILKETGAHAGPAVRSSTRDGGAGDGRARACLKPFRTSTPSSLPSAAADCLPVARRLPRRSTPTFTFSGPSLNRLMTPISPCKPGIASRFLRPTQLPMGCARPSGRADVSYLAASRRESPAGQRG